MSRPLTVILAAGGTGGHVFPALAAAAALRRRGARVIVASDGRGRRFQGDIETATVQSGRLVGSPFARLLDFLRIGFGGLQALFLMLRTRADVVVGFGGYPSLPTMAAALLLRRPTVLHDQNAVLGRVNRLFARRVGHVATAFDAVSGAPRKGAVVVGNPVREAVAAVGETAYVPPAADGPIRLLIFGGSQGARVLSDLLPAVVARLPDALKQRVLVTQQCRPEDLDRVRAAYAEAGLAPELATFFDDMPERLQAAHLVIARSGASTVAELAAAGRPSILIPFAAAMDDHQTANAEALVAAGAAWRISEAAATPDAVATMLGEAIGDPAILADAAVRARACARLDAAEALADLIEQAAGRRHRETGARVAGGIAA